MKPNDTPELDNALVRVLGGNDEIAPSFGFAASVMEAVRQETSAPAPIPFPWKWALPGFVACLVLIGSLLAGLAHTAALAISGATGGFRVENLLSLVPRGLADAPIGSGMEWSVVAVLVSLAIVWLTMRVVTGRE